MAERIAVVGLGYTGLPVALALARRWPGTIGYDIDADRVEELAAGRDRNGETAAAALRDSGLRLTADSADLTGCTFFVVCVPTPIDEHRRPDFAPLMEACRAVGAHLGSGAVVVFESTVYPGATEEQCGPALAAASGLECGRDFFLGYSPERINPGDTRHTLQTVVKVVAGQDEATLARIAAVYREIVPAGVHEAPSIMVAEAAKVLENTQRDINIALMNELAAICTRIGIRTADVIEAAQTKWNFLPFRPGLVGGHCVGVDPYWLAAKAERLGEHPQMILAGRRINDGMAGFVAREVVRRLARAGRPLAGARVAVLGATFKADVADIRNSRVPDMLAELESHGIDGVLSDPLADPAAVLAATGRRCIPMAEIGVAEAVVLAVPHSVYLETPAQLFALLAPGGLFVDVTSALSPGAMPPGVAYWSL